MTEPTDRIRAAWRFEAGTWPDMQFDDYRKQLIHETPKIKSFFRDGANEQFIISAPKGFGKTLLLIAKKKQLEERSHNSSKTLDADTENRAIPGAAAGGQIVDRPSGIFPSLSNRRIETLKKDYTFWKNLWKFSIMASVLKTNAAQTRKPITAIEGNSSRLFRDILTNNSQYLSAASIFVALVEADYSAQIGILKCANIVTRAFVPIHHSIVLFVDNVDEYFKPTLENKSRFPGDTDAYYRTRSNDIWTIAQAALAGAAYDIHKSNSHVKVFCTIRREAFLRLNEYDDQYAQILGCTIEIEYDRHDLLAIFSKNIDLMSDSDLATPSAANPIGQFVGAQTSAMRHRFVDKEEDAFNFVLRHTFYRPRDLMLIGQAISSIEPARRSRDSIKTAVDRASDDLVKGLIAEMEPFFALPDIESVAKFIPSNVITREEMETVAQMYAKEVGIADSECNRLLYPFAALYKIGMIGTIRREFTHVAVSRQYFVKPREVSMANGHDLPQTEEFYLVHPALDHLIAVRAGRAYLNNFHRANIVGNEMPWIEPTTSWFVLKGDICGFSGVMTTEFYKSLANRIHEWAEAACDSISFFEVAGGDSITLIDKSPDRVIEAAKEFARRARSNPDRPLMIRFGGAASPIEFTSVDRRLNDKWQEVIYPLGAALRISARLEPHAQRNQLLVDGEFVRLLGERGKGYGFCSVGSSEMPSLEFDTTKELFVIQKNRDDLPHHVQLWAMPLTSD